MFNNNNQITSFKNDLPYRDRYPSIKVEIKQVTKEGISKQSDISFLRHTHKLITINRTYPSEVQFVINKNIAGIVKLGEYIFWYSASDNFNRYLEILMIEEL